MTEMMKSLALFLISLLSIFTPLRAEPAVEKAAWPPVKYAHVVAYCYDPTQDDRGTRIVFEDGTHHRGIIAPFTRNLLPPQVARLSTLLHPEKEIPDDEVKCFNPHHGIVFYDENWKPVASLDICLTCVDFKSRPQHPAKELDWKAFAELFRKLGMPVFDEKAGPQAYTRLFEQHQGKAAE
jgi:hypothetical protein